MSSSSKTSSIKKKGNQSLYWNTGSSRYILIALLFINSSLHAEEIAPFKITNTKGSISLKFISDNQKITSQSIPEIKTERQLWQEELSLSMNSYIYHPNFLKMDLSAGLLSDQTKFYTSNYAYKTNQQVNNLSARLNFLSKKPTPFSIYYDKTNTTVPTGLTGSFLLERKRYGSEIALLAPLSPITVKLSTRKESTYGVGSNQITDDMTEQVRLDTSYSYGPGNYFNLNHHRNNRISRSGSLSLPIIEKESHTSASNIETNNYFGSEKQIRLISYMGHQVQEGFPDTETWFFRPNLDWKHNKNYTSYFTFSNNHIEQQNRITDNNKTTAKLNYSDNNTLSGSIGLSHSNSQSTGYEFEDKGANFSLSRKINAPYGQYGVSYNAGFNTRNQTSTLNLVPVYGDEYILNGITQETISQENIDATTIIISNITRTQIFIEGLDYDITVIGNQTLIERLVGGNIADGQSILIDYSYRTGGTIKYERLTQGLNINLKLGKFYDLYAKFYQSKQSLKEGTPNYNLNSSNGTILSLRANRPLKKGMAIGGELLAQQHNDESNPYNKQSIDAFIKFPLHKNTGLKLDTGLLMIDNENSDEDINKKMLGIQIHSHPWLRVRMNFESRFSVDTGGSTKRTLLNNALNFNWHYRRLNYRATVKHQSEEQGIIEHDSWSIHMNLHRAF